MNIPRQVPAGRLINNLKVPCRRCGTINITTCDANPLPKCKEILKRRCSSIMALSLLSISIRWQPPSIRLAMASSSCNKCTSLSLIKSPVERVIRDNMPADTVISLYSHKSAYRLYWRKILAKCSSNRPPEKQRKCFFFTGEVTRHNASTIDTISSSCRLKRRALLLE